MKRVAVLTDFYAADPTYSLNIIAEAQLRMLKRAGYDPVGIAQVDFRPERIWNDVELRGIPQSPKSNSVKFHEGWEENVQEIRDSLDRLLADIDVVITHDMIYQAAALWLNKAARLYAVDNPGTLWLNWVHSATASPVWTTRDARLNEMGDVQRHMPNSFVVYPNAWDVPRVARAFNCKQDDVKVVPHPTDCVEYWNFHEMTRRIVTDHELLSADVIMVYPVRLDRGKQVEYVIRTAHAIKKAGRTVRVVVPAFHSTGGDKVTYKEDLKRLAIDMGMTSSEVVFTNDYEELKLRCPRRVIRDLMLLCNAFVMPSRSETYSLIAQEAGLCGAFLVLNYDFPPMRSIYGDHAAYYKFSGNVDVLSGQHGSTNTEYHDIDAYFHELGQRIIYEVENNHVLAQMTRIRRDRNLDAIFRDHVEPLLYSQDG